jgi:hypothetical protein
VSSLGSHLARVRRIPLTIAPIDGVGWSDRRAGDQERSQDDDYKGTKRSFEHGTPPLGCARYRSRSVVSLTLCLPWRRGNSHLARAGQPGVSCALQNANGAAGFPPIADARRSDFSRGISWLAARQTNLPCRFLRSAPPRVHTGREAAADTRQDSSAPHREVGLPGKGGSAQFPDVLTCAIFSSLVAPHGSTSHSEK